MLRVSSRLVAPWLDVFDGGRKVAHLVETPRGRSLAVTDLAEGTTDTLPEHGDRLLAAAADPAGRFLVSADEDGVIRVTPATGGTPHLLLGHRSSVPVIRVSPDGRWIASAGQDNTVRLWPVPNLSKTPLQALPHGQLVARLHTLTNVRMVEDSESSTGWKFEVEPFPGWEEVPEW